MVEGASPWAEAYSSVCIASRGQSGHECGLTLRSSGTATGKALGPQGARCLSSASRAKPLTGVSPSAQTLGLMNSTVVLAEASLNTVLRDTWIDEVRLADTWFARFSNDLWLSAYEIELPAEHSLREMLSSHVPTLLTGVDAVNVPKMACLCALMRERVRSCNIDEASSLRITFERGGELRAVTNVPTVDWMWSVGSAPGDPYQTPSVAYCLAAGTVERGRLNYATPRSV